jgi:hypothetical protein
VTSEHRYFRPFQQCR